MKKNFMIVIAILFFQSLLLALPTSHTYAKETLGISMDKAEDGAYFHKNFAGFKRYHSSSKWWLKDSHKNFLWSISLGKRINSQKEFSSIINSLNSHYKQIGKCKITENAISVDGQIDRINIRYQQGYYTKKSAQELVNSVTEGVRMKWEYKYKGYDGDIIELVIDQTINFEGDVANAWITYKYKDLVKFLKDKKAKELKDKMDEKKRASTEAGAL